MRAAHPPGLPSRASAPSLAPRARCKIFRFSQFVLPGKKDRASGNIDAFLCVYDNVTGTRADRRLIKVAKALADETRFSILKVIARTGEASCGELARRFPVAQPTISHHTRVLVEAGLLTSRRAGQHSYFRLVDGALDVLGPALVTTLAARRRVAAAGRPRRSRALATIGNGRAGLAGRRGVKSRKPRSRNQRKGGTQT